jgi:DNA modification methylase
MHPTVKPVALIADAIKDASRRSNIVLDPFCGSGSTSACKSIGWGFSAGYIQKMLAGFRG